MVMEIEIGMHTQEMQRKMQSFLMHTVRKSYGKGTGLQVAVFLLLLFIKRKKIAL